MSERKRNVFKSLAQSEGLSERDFIESLLTRHGNQKSIAFALGISQSSVSQAFKRNNIRQIIKYEVQK